LTARRRRRSGSPNLILAESQLANQLRGSRRFAGGCEPTPDRALQKGLRVPLPPPRASRQTTGWGFLHPARQTLRELGQGGARTDGSPPPLHQPVEPQAAAPLARGQLPLVGLTSASGRQGDLHWRAEDFEDGPPAVRTTASVAWPAVIVSPPRRRYSTC